MDDVQFTGPRLEDEAEVRQLAEIHARAPLHWDPDFPVAEEDIVNWMGYVRASATKPEIHIIVARRAGTIVGTHWLTLIDRHGTPAARIETLWVHEAHRCSGLGRRMKENGEAWARDRGARMLLTQVASANVHMLEFNKRCGFEPSQVEMIKRLDA